jgi:AraC-like DNA-binding protein
MPAESYVERPPLPALADLVRTVWIQHIGPRPYAQRNLPTGGVELHCPVGGVPRLIGPLTGAIVEILAPGTTVVGVRFRPGVAAPLLGLPACELVDQAPDLDDIWSRDAVVLADLLFAAGSPEAALATLQGYLVARRADTDVPDPLVSRAVRQLMPWRIGHIGELSDHLAISQSQLRRRCHAAVGVGPKTLQRTLRFQGFLALVQSGERPSPAGAGEGLAALAAEAGYADHAHLSRECLRLTGLPPRAFLGDVAGRCACGHDHSASYTPILRARRRPAATLPSRN